MSNEEEKKYNHYYGEEFIDRVSRIDRSNKKETYIQDDLISNLIFICLLISKNSERELIPKVKTALKLKSCSRMAIINRIKILYDRYHGYLDEEKSDKQFWYMSCKTHEKKNILTLFQNNKQLYCNIDNIYDCSFHSNIDPNFDNPSSYDQIKYLKSFKKLIEFSLYNLFGNNTNNIINYQEPNEMIIEDQSDNEINEDKKDIKNNNNINNNNILNNNNDIISNASSKILSYSNSKETEEIVSEIVIENMDGTSKIIYLNKKKDLENLKATNEPFKNHITDLTYEFNHILKNIRCQNNMVQQIKKIKGIEKDDKKPCSELCFKNFLLCEEKLHNETYSALKDKQFPDIYELLLNKFLLILKFDPCHIYKLMKIFLKDIPNFKLNCTDIYLHLLSKKFSLRKVIKKELFDLNIKERELSKKNKAGLTPAQSKKIEENNLKSMNLNYVPCIHFGNEICDDKCLCSKRGFCEVFCRCNKILCKSAYHGCHCFKGDCTSNHCPCFINGRECNPQRCKNCNIQKSDEIRCKNLKLQMDFESKLIVGISQIAGWGLFSNEYIKKDSLIGEYKGELITDDIVNKRDKFREYENCTYMFKLDDEYTIDSRKMGNLLRYANHSKANSNSYTKIVFSEGQRKIVLIAKRDIFKGEEILFDYDGQGILGKQFSWINDEKKIQPINYNKDKNNINNHKNINSNSNINNNNNSVKKENLPKKTHLHSAIKSINNNPIVIEDDPKEDENNNNINIKDKSEILINRYFNNLFNGKNNINKNQDVQKENILISNNEKNIINNKKIEKKAEPEKKENANINILNKSLFAEQPKKEEKHLEKSDTKIKININNNNIANNKPKDNLIDLLSEANLNPKINNNNNKNTNNNPKVLFKTEEDDIMSLRNNFNRGNGHNIFDWMNRLGENLEKNKFINKKRTIEKPQENQNIEPDLNFTPNIKNNSENLNQIIINNNNQPKLDLEPTSTSKLRKPVFVGESLDESDDNISENKVEQKNYYINSKIRYNFITCQNINIIDPTKNVQENKVNKPINNQNIFTKNYYVDKNTNINNNLNINLGTNKTNIPEKDNNINTINKIFKFFQIGTIRIILELDNNPILNDFKFYSTVCTNMIKNIVSIKCKTVKLNELNIDVDLEKDIYGYLANNTNNKGFRIFNDYLNLFDNMCYYSQLPEINADLYIVSNGILFNKIRERIELKNSKIKKLLFFIKKK